MTHEHGAAGLVANSARARKYYELAAARGNPEAKYNLAVFHQQGLGGLPASETEAGRLLAEAAAEGVAEARRALGMKEASPETLRTDFSSKLQVMYRYRNVPFIYLRSKHLLLLFLTFY